MANKDKNGDEENVASWYEQFDLSLYKDYNFL